MRVLITGGAGFIGSHLAEALVSAGHRVTIIDDLSTGSLENLAHLQGGPNPLIFVRGSVCDESAMAGLVADCDVILHLAAAVGVKLIAENPVRTIETNINGSEIVLRLARRSGRKVFIASSSEVYGKSTRAPFSEDDDTMLGPTRFSRWSYACSKMADEFLALAYHEQFDLPVVICRFFNTIGPRQTGRYGMVVPRFVRWALAGEPIEIHGSGNQIRCFAHVADVVEALIRLIDCPQAVGEVINVGTDEPVTINSLADTIIEMTGSRSEKKHLSHEEAYGRPMDDLLIRIPDISKIRRLMGFEPKYNLRRTLRDIIDHEKARGEAKA